jgi:3-deoxy-manno-octulosonate cytidylyltransferase (CMP-KDO synthetase)
MVEHVYRRAAEARRGAPGVVATDDERVAAAVERFGGVARMTRASHRTGTDRIAEIAPQLDCDVIVNVQGDLPLIEPGMIDEVVAPLADASLEMATLRTAITDASEYANPNVVKVVVDRRGDALYFSRAPIPGGLGAPADRPAFKHIGLYAYRRSFVPAFAALPPTPLEVAESLEQLRALEHGYRIRTVETRFRSIEVDTPEDLDRVRRHLAVGARA